MGYILEWESDRHPRFIRTGHKRNKKLDKQKYKRIAKTKKKSKRANRKG